MLWNFGIILVTPRSFHFFPGRIFLYISGFFFKNLRNTEQISPMNIFVTGTTPIQEISAKFRIKIELKLKLNSSTLLSEFVCGKVHHSFPQNLSKSSLLYISNLPKHIRKYEIKNCQWKFHDHCTVIWTRILNRKFSRYRIIF